MKKSALLILVLVLLLPAACGRTEPPPPAAEASAPPPEAAAAPVPAAEYLRYAVSEERSFDLRSIDHDFGPEELVLLGEREGKSLVLRAPLAGGEAAELALDRTLPSVAQVAAGPDCLWLGDKTELRRLGPDGAETLSLTLPEVIEDLCCDASGRLCAAHKRSLTLVGPEGGTESIPLPKGFTGDRLCRLGNGDIAVFASRNKGDAASVQRLSGTALSDLEGAEIPGALSPGDASADFYYAGWTYQRLLSEGQQIFRFSGGKKQVVTDLSGAGREGKELGFCSRGADFLLLYEGEGRVGLLRLTPTAAAKKQLTVARIETNHIVTELIGRFNRENPDIYLVSRYYGGDDQETQLVLDLLAGDKPDLLSVNGTNLEVYGAKGLLRDLYPLLDADPALGRGDLVPSVLRALESGSGALYQLCTDFGLRTCVTFAQYAGEADRWSLEDLYRICEENPALTLRGERSGDYLLDDLLCSVLDKFADLETGELRFDSPEFIEFLRFIDRMDQRASGFSGEAADILLWYASFGSVEDYSRVAVELDGAEYRFIGAPSNGGTGNLCEIISRFAIFEGTSNEEDAWAFLRWALSEEVQRDAPCMPMRRSVLEARLEEGRKGAPERTVTQFADPEGAARGTNTETVTVTIPASPPLTEEQYAGFLRLLEGIEGVYADKLTHPCYRIIEEECAGFFRGTKSAEDTGKAVQDRLAIYLAERAP